MNFTFSHPLIVFVVSLVMLRLAAWVGLSVRFLLHVLPSGFQHIRHYGPLANCHRELKLEQCRQLLEAPRPPPPDEPLAYLDRFRRLTGLSLRDCPQCGQGQMVRIETFLPDAQPRGPPCIAS